MEAARAEERERRRMAMELHDRVGQSLALASMRLDDILCTCRNNSALEAVRDLVAEAIQEVRSLISTGLSQHFSGRGLVAALEEIAEKFGRLHALPVRISSSLTVEPEETVAAAVSRGVQELLVNVVKHAAAASVDIAVTGEARRLRVTVRDDGRGILSGDRRPPVGGFGLYSLRCRLEELGGMLRLSSSPGEGTEVEMIVPLHRFLSEREAVPGIPGVATVSGFAGAPYQENPD